MRRGGRHGRDAQLNLWRPGQAGAAPRPVHLRATGEDLDLGPGPDGAVWAVYMHCDGRGCRPLGYDLATGVEQELGVGLGIRPAIWRGRVALWRPPDRDGNRRLVVAHVGGVDQTHAVNVPVDADPRGGGPQATDLPGRRIAYIYSEGGESRSSPLRVGVLGSGQGVQPADLGGYGEECDYVVASPTLTRFGLTWLGASSGDAGACGAPSTALHRVFWRRGRDVTQRARLPVVSAVEGVLPGGGGAVTLAPPPGTHDPVVVEPCYLDDARHFHARYGCRVAAADRPRFRHERERG